MRIQLIEWYSALKNQVAVFRHVSYMCLHYARLNEWQKGIQLLGEYKTKVSQTDYVKIEEQLIIFAASEKIPLNELLRTLMRDIILYYQTNEFEAIVKLHDLLSGINETYQKVFCEQMNTK